MQDCPQCMNEINYLIGVVILTPHLLLNYNNHLLADLMQVKLINHGDHLPDLLFEKELKGQLIMHPLSLSILLHVSDLTPHLLCAHTININNND